MKKSNQNGLSTVFHYGLNGELLWEKDQAGSTKAYVWLDGRPLARIDNDTQIYYYHVDHLGTPQSMSDATAMTVWKADYEPFGKATVKVNTVENNLRFPGQYYDRETNLHYNYFRDYDPNTGRYIEADPIGLAGGVNVYLYGAADPVSQVDPFGLANGPAVNWMRKPGDTPSLRPPRRADGKPWGAGCGDATWDPLIPDLYPKACQKHDRCYEKQCGKEACDDRFFRDVWAEYRWYHGLAAPIIYYEAVNWFGDSAYATASTK